MLRIREIALVAMMVMLCSLVNAQDMESINLDAELDDIFNMEVSVASKNSVSINETPGVVTVVTKEEIQNSGARDLIDVLNLVPGFDFGMDVTSSIGAGIRGLWAYEGKLLVMIDGQEMQEQAFASFQFGNRINVDQIQKIEIIRGPGSSLYGGNAELGVINIVTHRAVNFQGLEVSGQVGQMERSLARSNVNLNYARKLNYWEIDLKAGYGKGVYSDQIFTDIFGDTYDLKNDGANTQTTNLNLGIQNRGFDFRFIYDDYQQQTVSLYDAMAERPFEQSFNGVFTGASYSIDLNDKLTLTPRLNFKSQKPWATDNEFTGYYNPAINRLLGNVQFEYQPNENLNVIAGGEYYNDRAKMKADNDFWFDGSEQLSLSNTSFFIQGILKTKLTNITAGMRYDKHSMVDGAFSPRVSLTRDFGKFHYKALYSRAFRTPSVANLVAYELYDDGSFDDISPNIKPEKSDVYEIELGYQFTSNFALNGNFFYTDIHDPMVYFYHYDEDEDVEYEGYYNSTRYGSKGFELEGKLNGKWGYVKANYSYYSVENINEVDYYAVVGNKKAVLAFPQHKFNLQSHFKLNDNFSINPSIIIKGKRYGFDSIDETEETSVLTEYDPIALINLYARYTRAFNLPMEIGVGVYDIFSQNYQYIQPFDGWHSPFPGPSREIMLKLKYNFSL